MFMLELEPRAARQIAVKERSATRLFILARTLESIALKLAPLPCASQEKCILLAIQARQNRPRRPSPGRVGHLRLFLPLQGGYRMSETLASAQVGKCAHTHAASWRAHATTTNRRGIPSQHRQSRRDLSRSPMGSATTSFLRGRRTGYPCFGQAQRPSTAVPWMSTQDNRTLVLQHVSLAP